MFQVALEKAVYNEDREAQTWETVRVFTILGFVLLRRMRESGDKNWTYSLLKVKKSEKRSLRKYMQETMTDENVGLEVHLWPDKCSRCNMPCAEKKFMCIWCAQKLQTQHRQTKTTADFWDKLTASPNKKQPEAKERKEKTTLVEPELENKRNKNKKRRKGRVKATNATTTIAEEGVLENAKIKATESNESGNRELKASIKKKGDTAKKQQKQQPPPELFSELSTASLPNESLNEEDIRSKDNSEPGVICCKYNFCAESDRLIGKLQKCYVATLCKDDCRIIFHRSCWDIFKGNNVTTKNVLGLGCATPDCYAPIVTIKVMDTDGVVKTEHVMVAKVGKAKKGKVNLESPIPTKNVKDKEGQKAEKPMNQQEALIFPPKDPQVKSVKSKEPTPVKTPKSTPTETEECRDKPDSVVDLTDQNRRLSQDLILVPEEQLTKLEKPAAGGNNGNNNNNQNQKGSSKKRVKKKKKKGGKVPFLLFSAPSHERTNAEMGSTEDLAPERGSSFDNNDNVTDVENTLEAKEFPSIVSAERETALAILEEALQQRGGQMTLKRLVADVIVEWDSDLRRALTTPTLKETLTTDQRQRFHVFVEDNLEYVTLTTSPSGMPVSSTTPFLSKTKFEPGVSESKAPPAMTEFTAEQQESNTTSSAVPRLDALANLRHSGPWGETFGNLQGHEEMHQVPSPVFPSFTYPTEDSLIFSPATINERGDVSRGGDGCVNDAERLEIALRTIEEQRNAIVDQRLTINRQRDLICQQQSCYQRLVAAFSEQHAMAGRQRVDAERSYVQLRDAYASTLTERKTLEETCVRLRMERALLEGKCQALKELLDYKSAGEDLPEKGEQSTVDGGSESNLGFCVGSERKTVNDYATMQEMDVSANSSNGAALVLPFPVRSLSGVAAGSAGDDVAILRPRIPRRLLGTVRVGSVSLLRIRRSTGISPAAKALVLKLPLAIYLRDGDGRRFPDSQRPTGVERDDGLLVRRRGGHELDVGHGAQPVHEGGHAFHGRNRDVRHLTLRDVNHLFLKLSREGL